MRKKSTSKQANQSKAIQHKIFVAFVIFLAVVLGLFAWYKTHTNKTAKTNLDKEDSFYGMYEQELKNLQDPFSTFGVNVQPIDKAAICRGNTIGMHKDDQGSLSTAYDYSKCEITQEGSVYLDSDVHRQQVAKAVLNIDKLLTKNGWQATGSNKIIRDRIDYILKNEPSLRETLRDTGVTPSELSSSDYIKRIDDKTVCNFTENESYIGDGEYFSADSAKLGISIGISCESKEK